MKGKILTIVLACVLAFSSVALGAEKVYAPKPAYQNTQYIEATDYRPASWSVTPIVGAFVMTQPGNNSDSALYLYGVQTEYRINKDFAVGVEMAGIQTSRNNNQVSGFNPSVFGRWYFADWGRTTPFLGGGVGMIMADSRFPVDKTMTALNADLGIDVLFADLGSYKLSGILAARYLKYGEWSSRGVEAPGVYSGVKFEF